MGQKNNNTKVYIFSSEFKILLLLLLTATKFETTQTNNTQLCSEKGSDHDDNRCRKLFQ